MAVALPEAVSGQTTGFLGVGCCRPTWSSLPRVGTTPQPERSNEMSRMGRSRRIVLVGGDPATASARQEHLRCVGYEVLTASDVLRDAHADVDIDADVDVAIVSADLPDDAGLELCRRLTEERGVTVLLWSSSPDQLRRIAGLEAGAVAYLIEPFGNEVLEASAAAALRDRKLGDQLDLAVTINGLGYWEWDVESGVVSWTANLETMHGFEPGTFPGTIEEFQNTIHPDDRHRVWSGIDAALAGSGDRFETAYEFVRSDGSSGHLVGRGRVLRRRDGRPYELTGVALEVTDRVAGARRNDALIAYSNALMTAASLSEGREVVTKQGPAVTTADLVDVEWLPIEDETHRAGVESDHLLDHLATPAAESTGELTFDEVALTVDDEPIVAVASVSVVTASGTGRLAVGWRNRPSFDLDDRRFLELFARSSLAAMRQLSDYERQLGIGLTLQRALTPRVAEVPGLDLASAYRPAGRAALIGGDWFDAVTVGPGRAAIVVGDVAGHGMSASADAAGVRHTTRACLAGDDDLVTAMRSVDDLLSSSPERPCSTAAVVSLDVETGDGALVLAGHPPPVIRRADGSAFVLEVSPGPLLGFGLWADADPTLHRFRLDRGDILVLYTDGAIERRSVPVDVGIDDLVDMVAATDDLDALVSAAADASAEASSLDDDTIVLAVRRS